MEEIVQLFDRRGEVGEEHKAIKVREGLLEDRRGKRHALGGVQEQSEKFCGSRSISPRGRVSIKQLGGGARSSLTTTFNKVHRSKPPCAIQFGKLKHPVRKCSE